MLIRLASSLRAAACCHLLFDDLTIPFINTLRCLLALARHRSVLVIYFFQMVELVLEDFQEAIQNEVWLTFREGFIDVLVEIVECELMAHYYVDVENIQLFAQKFISQVDLFFEIDLVEGHEGLRVECCQVAEEDENTPRNDQKILFLKEICHWGF